METVLEQQRRYHEERDRLMESMVQEHLHVKKTVKEQILSAHRLRILLDRYMETCRAIGQLYDDEDGQRREELGAISGPNEFAEFYTRLKDIREFHRRHPNEIFVPMSIEFDKIAKARENATAVENCDLVEFSDEEAFGRFLDLHECYNLFINLKGVDGRIDYITYLNIFDRMFDMPRERKTQNYRNYLEQLLQYLEGFLYRTRPLFDIEQETRDLREQFERQWADSTFPGWPKETAGALTHTGAHLDLSAFGSWEELASLGLDRLKSALMALGLKCGGTLEERARRLFDTKGKQLSDIEASLFAKAKPLKSGDMRDKSKELAWLEGRVYHLVELLSEQRAASKENVQRRQARTGAERDESDDDDDEADVDEEEDDDDTIPYNPKNLPLGWDGKPIPYWLYKLHGLNLYFNCEICGNQKYRGPKAFQIHFSEWRHAHGMRCLGIPNSPHFHNVTQIEDAIALWQKLKATREIDKWKPDQEEEYEDSSGNVINRKTYEDLRRQGLL